jgi:hypothetical protein
MFFRTVMLGHSAYDWNTMPILRLYAGTFTCLLESKTVWSVNVMLPTSGVSRPASPRDAIQRRVGLAESVTGSNVRHI